MFQTLNLVRDNSTLTNFKQWAMVISSWFSTAGWAQSSDTGQVNWSTIASVPAVNNYVYEIWQPNDGLTTFYFKVEYGTGSASGNTSPSLRLSVGTTTNGSGTLTGFIIPPQIFPTTPVNVTSTSSQWQCHFVGEHGLIGLMMWRDDTTFNAPLFFGLQRSKNSSGAYTSDHITLLGIGQNGSNNDYVFQQSLAFGLGVGNAVPQGASSNGGLICLRNGAVSSDVFDGKAPISPVFPSIGGFANPLDAFAVGAMNDFTEGALYTIAAADMPYGVAHTYIASKTSPFRQAGNVFANNSALLMRLD